MVTHADIPSKDLSSVVDVRRTKLHGRAFYESLGSPKVVLAPMVDQSEFAWRVLTRSFLDTSASGELLAYSPMYHARLFGSTEQHRQRFFQPTKASAAALCASLTHTPSDEPYNDGRSDLDRPLFVQFCANEPDELLQAAKLVQNYCDAVDLNLGCPQGIARKGKYGAFLQEDQDLVFRLINKLHLNLDIPVTAKIRVLDTKEATLAYAKNVLSAGASILTVHGRRREQKGHYTGLADWSMIRYLRDNLPSETVLFANGNILQHQDINRCLTVTGADAVMSAEGNLHDPTIFAPKPSEPNTTAYWQSSITSKGGYRVDYVFRRYLSIIYKYVLEEPEPTRQPLFDPRAPFTDELTIVSPYEPDEEGPPRKKTKKQKRAPSLSPSLTGMQGHLFSLLRHLVSVHTNVRDALAKARPGNMAAFEYVLALTEQAVRRGLVEYSYNPTKYEEFVGDDNALKEQSASYELDYESSVRTVQACKMPWWVCQPYVRPLPKEALEKGAIQPSMKKPKMIEATAMANGHSGVGESQGCRNSKLSNAPKRKATESVEAIFEKERETKHSKENGYQPSVACG